jgi:acyl transferase domain-containing protein/thioesterase domain-containing protein/acyl carrier protein
VVQREWGEWKRPRVTVEGETREYPRMAGISSFGAGGANAHIIVEEYVAVNDHKPTTTVDEGQASIIVLSAKTEAQLKSQAWNLVSAIHTRRLADADLPSIAYTLQAGREAMEERMAVIVNTTKELEEKLQAFAESRAEPGEVYRGQVRRGRESLTLLVGDEEFGETIDKWIQRGKFGKLADIWVKGFDIDWNKLYEERKPRRLSLPTYPFARERYWVHVMGKGNQAENGLNGGKASSRGSNTSVHENIPDVPASEAASLLRYVEEWKLQADDEIPVGNQPIQLIHFTEDEQQSSALAGLLEGQHDQSRLIRVVKGTLFSRLGSTRYEVPVEGEVGYRALWESLISGEDREGAGEWVVLYGWGEGMSKIQGLHSLLKSNAGSGVGLKRLIITGTAVDDLASCYDLSLIGYERSLRSAMPQLSVRVVYGDEEGLRTEQIWENLWRGGVIRYRGGLRYQLGYRAAPDSGAVRTVLRKQGVYLITGGGGGLGKVFAEHLAQSYQARIALVGRSPLDERLRERLKELKSSGAQEAIYYSGDVGDREQMEEVVGEMQERWGEINGIIHGAGVESKRSVMEKEWEEFRGVLRPKMEGTRVVDEVTAELGLDFVCYFSSSSAVLGDGGGCDYAIGNRYQMAYGGYREELRRRGKRRGQTLVMNWPLWREGGMGEVGSERIEMYLKSSGQRYLEREEGVAAWEEALGKEAEQELVLAGQAGRVEGFLSRIYSGHRDQRPAPSRSRSERGQERAGSRTRDQGPGMDSGSLRESVAEDLKERIGELLKIKQERLDEKTNFADIGFDSIGLAEFSRVLSELYGIEVVPNVFFNYSTIEKLSEHLIERHRPVLKALYRPEGRDESPEKPEPVVTQRETEERRVEVGRRRGGETRREEAIAIIGMSGRFPGADNVEELWELLSAGRKAIGEIPRERWDWREYYQWPGAGENRIAANKGGFIRGLDEFDPLFFEISPREAQWMDPRQRLMLEEAWRALEDGGYAGERIRGGNCGVFIGVEEGFYGDAEGSQSLMTSNHNAILAARISYFLDLQGPNLAINTACSSGLVAVHYACQSLQRGDCELALAGGVNILSSPLTYVALSQSGMLSEEGECYAFDNRANGMVPGEAVAVVMLKPLSKAEADGDAIYGVIRGSGVNYDGKTNGITAPSALSQAKLVESILKRSEVKPESVQYILAHSVGSSLGDPIEVQALSDAFKRYTDERQFCVLGSIKPLIGHTFAASGVVSLIGMCMAIKHRMMPALCNYREANEYIDFQSSPFYVNEENRNWEIADEACPRRGIVGATGMSGTNAFALIEEYIPENTPRRTTPDDLSSAANGEPDSEPVLIVLSAKTESVLRMYANNLNRQLSARNDLNLLDVAYTLQTGREPMDCRLAIIASSKDSLIDKLNTYLNEPDEDGLRLNAIYTTKQRESAGRLQNSASSGNLATRQLSASSRRHKLNELATLWVCGANVDWSALYIGRTVKRVSLTSYPFERSSCNNGHGISTPGRLGSGIFNRATKHVHDASDESPDKIIEIISSYSKVDVNRINLTSAISSLGIDSLLMMNMISSIEDLYSIDLSLEEIIGCESIAQFCEMVSNKKRSAGAHREPNKYREFEILQSNGELAPVVWFHGSLGTIQGYVGLSQHLGKTLPFYAIQSRGIKGSDEPIDNLIEMASYYVEILLTRGFGSNILFQLGGYSEGGLIAYEVARQLQLRGHTVNNVMMIDVPYPYNSSPFFNDADIRKLRYAMVYLNILIINNLGGFTDINSLRLDNVSVENIVPYLVNAGMEKGLKYSSQELRAMIDQYYKIAEANERAAESYVIGDLSNPSAIECHYFQRKSRGVYFHPERFKMPIIEKVNRYYRNKKCADKWRRNLPNFNYHLTTASDHFSLLSEKEPFELILGTCRDLYNVRLSHTAQE